MKVIATEYQIVLDKQEARVVLAALDYCSHRITKHQKNVGADPEQIDAMRGELRKIIGL